MANTRQPTQPTGRQERLPPHDNEAEEAILGSFLIDGDEVMPIVEAFLKPSDFFGERAKWIYEAALSVHKRTEGVNEITVARELAYNEKLEAIGGAAYLSHLIAITPTPFHAKYYAGIVARLALCRRMIMAGGHISRIGFAADPDMAASVNCIGAIIDELYDDWERIADKSEPVEPEPFIKGGVIL